MSETKIVLSTIGPLVILAPIVFVSSLGIPSLLGRKLGERATGRLSFVTVTTGLIAAVTVLVGMLLDGTRHGVMEFGEWVAIPGYHFHLQIVFDRLSIPFAILTYLLCGVISAFAFRYLHREPGFNRFFVFFAIFMLGMVSASLAGTIETLFVGWELVGLSSVMLVAFFQERPAPVRNALRLWVVYRWSDAALLLAAIVLHHRSGGEFHALLGDRPWPEGHPSVSAAWGGSVALLLIIAAAGKSALLPFSGWLPRAMEGPTPSSAIFYGALSVHLGAFLLLRVSPLLDSLPVFAALLVVWGLATAIHAALMARVQTDVKSALSFASLVQVGLIVAEIGLGFPYLALVHLLGNACFRTLQFLRAPSLLQDFRRLENAMGERLPRPDGPFPQASFGFRLWLYRWALERGYLDALLQTLIVEPFLAGVRTFDSWERRWTAFLSGRTAPTQPTTAAPEIEDIV